MKKIIIRILGTSKIESDFKVTLPPEVIELLKLTENEEIVWLESEDKKVYIEKMNETYKEVLKLVKEAMKKLKKMSKNDFESANI